MSFAELLDDTFKAPSSGMSRDELVHEFISLDRQYREIGDRRKDLAMEIAGLAFENRVDQNTGHVASTDGKSIKVVFGKDYGLDSNLMEDVLNLLGEAEFNDLFTTTKKYAARKRALKTFLNTTWPNENFETAKAIIKEAIIVKDKAPYVSVEKD